MPYRIRRVVTGHDKDGKSVFVMDGRASNVLEMASMPGVALTDLWRTKTSPASNVGNADAATGRIVLEPPAEGTTLRIVELPPDSKWRKSADAMKAFASIGAVEKQRAEDAKRSAELAAQLQGQIQTLEANVAPVREEIKYVPVTTGCGPSVGRAAQWVRDALGPGRSPARP
jgi:hypothetical protein